MSTLNEFEEQVRAADGQQTSSGYYENLVHNVLGEDALRAMEIPPVKKYLGPIRERTTGQIFGPRGVGKTMVRDALALSLTRNLDFGPFKSEKAAGVLIIDGEMGADQLQARQILADGLPPAVRPLDYIINEHLYRQGMPVINLSDPLWRDAFIQLIKETGSRWDVIFLDNLSAFLPGFRENDTEAWGPINAFLLQLKWLGKCVVFYHHSGKNGDQRGTSSREDALDFVLKLSLPAGYDPQDGCKCDVTMTKSRSLTGAEAAPFTFEVKEKPSGGLTWLITGQRESKKELIVALLGNGISQREVADMMGIDKAYISRTKKWGVNNNLLTEAGEFTASGHLKFGGFDIEKYTG